MLVTMILVNETGEYYLSVKDEILVNQTGEFYLSVKDEDFGAFPC